MKNYNNYSDMITFTRASSGTALAKISGGGNLLSGDSSTFTNGFGDWVFYTGGTATVSNGAFTYSGSGGTTYQIGNFLTVGKAYKITYDFTRTVDTYGLMVGDRLSTSTQVRTPLGDGQLSGTITGYIICGFASAVIGVYANSGGSGTIDNVIIEEILYDQPDGTLQLFNHPTNQPRVEYDYQGNRLGLLVEEARTNLIPYSDTSAGWSRTTDITKTSNYSTGPDGLSSSIRLQKPSNSGVSSYFNAGLLISGGTANKTFTVSCWAKGTGKFQLKNTHGGVIDSFSSDIDATPNWTRYEFTVTNSSIAGNGLQYVGLSWNSTDSKASVVDIEIFGFQLEQGSFATSYIPTAGSTVTRAADVASIGVGEFGYNKTAGTVLVQFDSASLSNSTIYGFDNGGSTQGNTALIWPANKITYQVFSNGSTAVNATFDDYKTANKVSKVATCYRTNDFAAVLNGGTIATDSAGALPTVTQLRLGNYVGGGTTFDMTGHISSIAYYPRRLTNAQIQKLTSVSTNSTLSLTFDGTSDSYLETNIHG